MALQPLRREFRLTLSQVDRGREADETLIVGQHPSETGEHLVLRVLAFCLVHQDGIEFGPGLSTPDAADVWAHDLTGRLTAWVECGTAPLERLRKVAQHNPGAEVHAVFDDPRRRRELDDELAAQAAERGKGLVVKGGGRAEAWLVDGALVRALADRMDARGRRCRWAVTIVGDHVYVDADGEQLDGAAERSLLSE